MGKQPKKKNKLATLKRLKQQAKMMQIRRWKNKDTSRSVYKVPALAVLCGKVAKKFKLLPEPKKFTPPESFSIVGGKPLRKRSARLSTDDTREENRKKKSRNPRRLVTLCQIVIKEHNLLPQCDRIRPSPGTSLINKKRGRPRKDISKDAPTKRVKQAKGRPRKDAAASEDNTSKTVTYVNYSTFLRESQIIRQIKVEEELNQPVVTEVDPLRQCDDDYTIVVKEENIEDEDDITTQEDSSTVQVPQATSMGITINPLASAEIPGPSGRAEAHYMTVLMDEYQVFANSIAEQLRALPSNRALLLQLDIQSMIDNEKQLIMHEN